jgi:hypothetical protein
MVAAQLHLAKLLVDAGTHHHQAQLTAMVSDGCYE